MALQAQSFCTAEMHNSHRVHLSTTLSNPTLLGSKGASFRTMIFFRININLHRSQKKTKRKFVDQAQMKHELTAVVQPMHKEKLAGL